MVLVCCYVVTQPRLGRPSIVGGANSAPLFIRGSADSNKTNSNVPVGNPLRSSQTVMTQGYGVGSHSPAASWGAIDLAIDGDNDGNADSGATQDTPIYATHAGVTRVVPDSWPGGNYLSIGNEHYKTAYCHISRFAVDGGVTVKAGQLVGYVGSTGQSSGPHLHYEVWKDGVNVNPLDYLTLP